MSVKRLIIGSISLIFIVLFFSGLFAPGGPLGVGATSPLRVLDFGTILGAFGRMGNLADPSYGSVAANFQGVGGSGARNGFMFALTLFPTIILAIGCVKVVEYLGGLEVAELLMRPLLKPLMGIPGTSGIPMIASLQSTDAGASLTKQMKDSKTLTKKETLIFTAFQFAAGAPIGNYFASGAALFPFLGPTAIGVPFGMILIFKVVAANLMRLYLMKFYKEEEGAA
ncbi:MAG: hypothetical protein FWD91_07310 [Treponema sp.]|nr:hypothetical protein [Treponema sp.]